MNVGARKYGDKRVFPFRLGKTRNTINAVSGRWCPGEDSNLHGFHR